MASYRLTRRARRDVLQIWQYIADDNEQAADRFIDLLIRYFSLLGDNPRAGRRRARQFGGATTQLSRERLPHPLSDPTEPGVCVMHVVHARRDIEAVLGRSNSLDCL